jgi:hypothetical protein
MNLGGRDSNECQNTTQNVIDVTSDKCHCQIILFEWKLIFALDNSLTLNNEENSVIDKYEKQRSIY